MHPNNTLADRLREQGTPVLTAWQQRLEHGGWIECLIVNGAPVMVHTFDGGWEAFTANGGNTIDSTVEDVLQRTNRITGGEFPIAD